jgi:lysophospholipase L1-like esterase
MNGKLEAQKAYLEGLINELSATLTKSIADNKVLIEGLQKDITTLQGTAAEHASRIAQNSSTIAANTQNIIDLSKSIYANKEDITANEKAIANNKALIEANAKLIADKVGGSYVNQAVGGARLVTLAEGSSYHSIVDNLSNLPTDGDLYCFEGGVNDHWNGVPLGDFSPTDYTGTLDTKTMCGALEYIFRYAITNFVGKPICFVITHKCPYQGDIKGNSFADFRDKMIGICEKYAIPYYDAWAESGLGSWSEAQLNNYFVNFSTKAEVGEGDGTHPNIEGYKRYYIPQLVSLFEKILPMGIENEEPDDEVGYTNILNEVGWEKGVYIKPDGSLASKTGRYVTGLIPCKFNDIIRLKNVSMPDDKSDYQNRIGYYNTDGTTRTVWNLVTDDGGKQHNAIYEEGNLIQFTVSSDGPIRLCCTGIDETSIITVNQEI